jgi:hypothetical protein
MVQQTLLSLLLVATTAQAYQLKQDATGSTVRWGGSVGFVVDAATAEKLKEPRALEAIAAAVESFRRSVPQLDVTVHTGTTSGVGYDRSGSRNQNEILILEEWPFDPSFIAATVVTMDTKTHRILDADIALNAQNRKFKVMTNPDKYAAHDDIQNTVTHELGHAFGLAHNPDKADAVMYPTANPGETQKRELSTDDVEGLSTLYAGVVAADEGPVTAGCSAAGSAPTGFGALVFFFSALLALAKKARPVSTGSATRVARLTAATLALGSLTAFASETQTSVDPSAARWVFTAQVKNVRTLPPTPSTRILISEVELSVHGCFKGDCPTTLTVRVPGGRSGDIEQVVMGRPLPTAGEVMGVLVEAPKPSALSASAGGLSPLSNGTAGATSLYRLATPEEFQAFASGIASVDSRR